MTSKSDDAIVEEFRRRRRAHAESFDHDLRRITKDFQRQEAEGKTPVVQRPPRKPSRGDKRASA